MLLSFRKAAHEAIVKTPPAPKPAIYNTVLVNTCRRVHELVQLTNLAATSISRLVLSPQSSVPRAAKNTATWLAPRRPSTLDSRPYKGVNVQVARRNAVPSQDAWFERSNSEEMEDRTALRRPEGQVTSLLRYE